MALLDGFEPPNKGVKVPRLTPWQQEYVCVEDRTCTCTSGLSGRRPTNRTYIVLLNPSHDITHLNDFNKYYKLNIEAKVSHLYDLL